MGCGLWPRPRIQGLGFASAEASPILRQFEASSDPGELLALSGELQKGV